MLLNPDSTIEGRRGIKEKDIVPVEPKPAFTDFIGPTSLVVAAVDLFSNRRLAGVV